MAKDKKIKALLELLKIKENEVLELKAKISTQKKINEQKKKNKLNNCESDSSDESDNSSSEEDKDNIDTTTFDTEMEELSNKSHKEIVKVAKSKYGVETSGKKTQILERIKNSIIKSKESSNKQKEQSQKSKQLLLPMERGEMLFFKILRNKYLFRQILNQLQTGRHAFKYHELFDVQFLIKLNQTALLKDKVKRGEYLTGFQSETLEPIFSFIRDDSQFYSNLFKNYANSTINNFSIQYRAYYAVSRKCIGALKLLIKEYNYIPTKESINMSIKKNSLKIFICLVQYFIDNNETLPLDEDELWKSIFSNESQDNRRKRSKLIIFLIDTLTLSLPNFTATRISKIYSPTPVEENYSINDLYNSIRSMYYSKIYKQTHDQTTPTKLTSSKSKAVSNEFNSLKQSIETLFTTQELKQKLFNFFYFNQDNKQDEKYQVVIKLLIIYIKVVGTQSHFSALLTGFEALRFFDEPEYTASINGLRFGNYSIFAKESEYFNFSGHSKCNNGEGLEDVSNLFQFQKNKEMQIKFVSEVIDSLISKIPKIGVSKSQDFLNLVISYGNVDLIQLAYTLLDKPKLIIESRPVIHSPYQSYRFGEFYSIKTPEVLEYIFNNCLKEKDKPYSITEFIYNGRFDLIEKYASLLPKGSQLVLDTINCKPDSTSVVLKTLILLFKNPTLSNGLVLGSSFFLSFNFSKVLSISDMVYLLDNCKFEPLFPLNLMNMGESLFKIQIKKWVFYYRKKYYINGNVLPGYKNSLVDCDTFSVVFQPNKELFDSNGGEFSGDFISKFMNFYFPIKNGNDQKESSDSEKEESDNEELDYKGIDKAKSYLYQILVNLSLKGNKKIFESLVQNGYSRVFKKFFFNQIQLRELVINSLSGDHLDLAIYLLDKCGITITSQQFNSKARKNTATYVYLLDRYKNEMVV